MNLKYEETRAKLPELLNRVYKLFFLTSGQCLIYTINNDPIGLLQNEFASGEPNMQLLKLIAEKADMFFLGKYKIWAQEMDKEDFMRVTHLTQVDINLNSAMQTKPHAPTRFFGADYDPVHDKGRLLNQYGRVLSVMIDEQWRTLKEIADITKDPEASISAQLRMIGKSGYKKERRSRGKRENGLYEYKITKI